MSTVSERAARDAQIRELDAAGTPRNQIARMVECSQRTVQYVLNPTPDATETPFQVMPPLSADEHAALEDSIREYGILTPIIVDQTGVIIEGHHRAAIANQLGIKCPREVRSFPHDTARRTAAYELNTNRRHLTQEQKRELVAASITADPALSDRQHARRCGVSHPTVAKIRAELTSLGAVVNLSTRTDSAGRAQPATKPQPDRDALDRDLAALTPPPAPTATAAPCVGCGQTYPPEQMYGDIGEYVCERCEHPTASLAMELADWADRLTSPNPLTTHDSDTLAALLRAAAEAINRQTRPY